MSSSLQNQVSGSSKSLSLLNSGFFSGGEFPNFIGLKTGSCFLFKKFRIKFTQVSKIGFVVLGKVLADKQFYFAKSCFVAKFIFCKVRSPKSASRFLAKVLASLVQALSPGSFFSGKLFFWQSQFLAKVLASPQLLRSANSKLISLAKSGL